MIKELPLLEVGLTTHNAREVSWWLGSKDTTRAFTIYLGFSGRTLAGC